MTDIIVLICCILGGFFVGRYTQSVINAKNLFYLDTLKYIENLQLNIKTKQIGISSFNQEYSKICTSEFKAFLLDNKIEVRLSPAERKNILFFTLYHRIYQKSRASFVSVNSEKQAINGNKAAF